jgi:hypothetical protein
MQRQRPISPFAMSQPYSRAGGQAPGPALSAMLAGRTLYGMNPMDAQRAAQTASRPGTQQLQSLLASLLR